MANEERNGHEGGSDAVGATDDAAGGSTKDTTEARGDVGSVGHDATASSQTPDGDSSEASGPSEVSESAEPSEASGPSEASDSGDSSEASESAEPSEASGPSETSESAEPSEASGPSETSESGDPNEASGPSEASDSGDSSEASGSSEASESAEPSETSDSGAAGEESPDAADEPRAPEIASLSPATGPLSGGTEIVVEGSGFAVDCRAEIGGEPSEVSRESDERLRLSTPPRGDAGHVDVKITNPDGQSGLRVNGFYYDAAPSIERLNPAEGSVKGGQTVYLVGSGFQEGCEVTIGASVPTVRWVAPTHLELTLVAHPGGDHDVTVLNPNGTSAKLEAAFHFHAGPEVAQVEPAHGPLEGGLEVKVVGHHFARGAEVRFGGQGPLLVARVSSSELRVWVPAAADPGAVAVQVENPDGLTHELTDGYKYDSGPAPVVKSVSPDTTPLEGGLVVIGGENFGGTCRVLIGGKEAEVTKRSPSELTVVTPAVPHGGAAVVEVVNADEQSHRLEGGFSYITVLPPELVAVHPDHGSVTGGLTLTLTGNNFADGCRVVIGGIEAQAEFVSASQLTAITPQCSEAGRVVVELKNPNGHASSLANAFTYEEKPKPAITDVYPNEGKATGGTKVTIEGANFVKGSQVSLGQVRAAKVAFQDPSTLVFVTPGGRAGLADLVVTLPDGQSCTRPKAFQYNAVKPPTVASVSPNRGGVDGGTAIEVEGTGFVEGSALLVDGQPAKVTKVTATSIEGKTPKGKKGQMVDVAVRNPDGQQAVAKRAFMYDARY